MPFIAIVKGIFSLLSAIPELIKVWNSIKKALDNAQKDRFNDGIVQLKEATTSDDIKEAARKIAKNS